MIKHDYMTITLAVTWKTDRLPAPGLTENEIQLLELCSITRSSVLSRSRATKLQCVSIPFLLFQSSSGMFGAMLRATILLCGGHNITRNTASNIARNKVAACMCPSLLLLFHSTSGMFGAMLRATILRWTHGTTEVVRDV